MSAKVIDISVLSQKRVERETATTPLIDNKNEVFSKDLEQLLREARARKDILLSTSPTPVEFKKYLEGKIGEVLVDRRLIDPSHFLCGMYVARLLTETIRTGPESWYAIDFRQKAQETDSFIPLKAGGDMCFLIVAVFPERGNWRLMDIEYYEKMGVGFYYDFYHRAGSEIGYHMGHCFKTIAEVTQSCLASF